MYFMRLYGCTDIFCIAEYRGTQDMYSTVTCIFLICIYMHMDAPFCDVVLVVRTWMRFMMLGTWMPLVDTNVVLWFMYMDANVDAIQCFLGFYIFG